MKHSAVNLYLRWKVAVSTMILVESENDSAVNKTRRGKYKGLYKKTKTKTKVRIKRKKNHKEYCTTILTPPRHFVPVVDGTSSEVCVEDGDDSWW